jgi:hypothetical protein
MTVKTYDMSGYRLATVQKWTGSNGLSGYWEAASLPVDLATDTLVTMGRIVTGTLYAGDLLDIEAWARVTNDTGYTVGIGYHMKAYEYTQPGVANPEFAIESMNGQNVTPNGQTHHLPVHWSGLYEVPAVLDGKRIVLCFRLDAHSSAALAGDVIAVDGGYGRFTVAHCRKVV